MRKIELFTTWSQQVATLMHFFRHTILIVEDIYSEVLHILSRNIQMIIVCWKEQYQCSHFPLIVTVPLLIWR